MTTDTTKPATPALKDQAGKDVAAKGNTGNGVEEFHAFLAANPDTQYVDALLFDLCGIVRGKRYPVADAAKLWEDGMMIPYSAYVLDVTGDCPDSGGRGISDGDPDGVARPVAGTLTSVPWSEVPAAEVMVTLDEDLSSSVVDPRNVLRRIEARFRAEGLNPVVAMELEFYLIDPEERRPDGAPLPPIAPGSKVRDKATQMYGLAPLDDYTAFLRDVELACAAFKVPYYTVSSENAPAQFEINLKHVTSAVRAADDASLLIHIVERVARHHGFQASFMAKPFVDQAGSGLHMHISVYDEDGKNIFDNGSKEGSDALHHAIGGLMAVWPEAMAVYAPNANSYRRFAPNNYVPVARSWGVNNRSVAFRVPAGDGRSRRVEHRVCGADANLYLALSATLAGIHYGIAQRLDPGPACTGNACKELDRDLPWMWRQALIRMEKAHILPDYMGADYVTLYTETKWAELDKYTAVISPHEYQWYL